MPRAWPHQGGRPALHYVLEEEGRRKRWQPHLNAERIEAITRALADIGPGELSRQLAESGRANPAPMN